MGQCQTICEQSSNKANEYNHQMSLPEVKIDIMDPLISSNSTPNDPPQEEMGDDKVILSYPASHRVQESPESIFKKEQSLSVRTLDVVTIDFISGAKYKGQVKGDNIREGQGQCKWADGTSYTGNWKENQFHGFGRLTYSNQDVYEGSFEQGKAHGHGRFIQAAGTVYSGEWVHDKQHGTGKETYAGTINANMKDGSCYSGQFLDGLKTGQGLMKFNDGSSYQGQFLNGQLHGRGLYIWDDLRQYTGTWANNQIHGKGTTVWPDGRIYEGEYKNGMKNGYGAYTWSDGRKYIGDWRNGQQDGVGTLINKDGTTRRGEWKQGQRVRWLDGSMAENTASKLKTVPSDNKIMIHDRKGVVKESSLYQDMQL